MPFRTLITAAAAAVGLSACATAPQPTTTATPGAVASAPPAAAPAAAATGAKPMPFPELLATGKKFGAWLVAGQIDSLIANADTGFVRDNGRANLEQLIANIAVRGGNELKLVEEKMVKRNGRPQYWRTATYERAPEDVLIRLVITPERKLAGFGIGLASQAPPVDP